MNETKWGEIDHGLVPDEVWGSPPFMAQLAVDIESLMQEAQAKLPSGDMYEIRVRAPIDVRHGVCWFRTADMQSLSEDDRRSTFDLDKGEAYGGYVLVGRFKTP